MTLLLVFALVTLALFALFLGGGLVAQGYLYQDPADRLPIRSLVGALVVGGFITFWVWVDQHSPGRYDTFFNFAPYSTTEFTEFDAVRWTGAGDGKLTTDENGKLVEVTVKYKRSLGGKGAQFLEEGTDQKFEPNSTQYMTGAILVKGPDDPEPVRYNALVKEDPRTKMKTYTPERRFVEENGSRYVEAHQPGTLFVPSTGTVAVALLLNFLLFVVWLAATWPILRFSFGHALMLTAACGLLVMLVVMPLLFKPNRVKPPAPPPTTAAAIRSQESGDRSQRAEDRGQKTKNADWLTPDS